MQNQIHTEKNNLQEQIYKIYRERNQEGLLLGWKGENFLGGGHENFMCLIFGEWLYNCQN